MCAMWIVSRIVPPLHGGGRCWGHELGVTGMRMHAAFPAPYFPLEHGVRDGELSGIRLYLNTAHFVCFRNSRITV
jgi:hypothetical protein